MLFERQRVLLTLLDALGAECSPTDFQKLLFLYTRGQKTPSYEFVPYKFGCFSFTSYADKRRLIDRGLLEDLPDAWKLTAVGRMTIRKRAVEPVAAARFHKEHASIRGDELIAKVYREHPYFASRSVIVDKVLLGSQERERVANALPTSAAPGLLTIGYEGKCLESYVNQLLRASVTLLCDVRRNPLSRKYGFSKSTLRSACDNLGICYEHMPELGIPSEDRRELKTQADYDALFEGYERESLPRQADALDRIRAWILGGHRVALTCFELHPQQCHRHCVAEALEGRAGCTSLKTIHL